MGDVINLNQVRKARAKTEAEKAADSNRVAHGTPKALKKKTRTDRQKSEKTHAGKKLDGKAQETGKDE
jgi:hypothetical protein